MYRTFLYILHSITGGLHSPLPHTQISLLISLFVCFWHSKFYLSHNFILKKVAKSPKCDWRHLNSYIFFYFLFCSWTNKQRHATEKPPRWLTAACLWERTCLSVFKWSVIPRREHRWARARSREMSFSLHLCCRLLDGRDSFAATEARYKWTDGLWAPLKAERTTHEERDGENAAAAPPRPSRGAPADRNPASPREPSGDIGRRGEGQRGRRGDAMWGENRHRLDPARTPGERVQLHRRSLGERGRWRRRRRRRGCCCWSRWRWWRRNWRRRSRRRGGIPTPVIR